MCLHACPKTILIAVNVWFLEGIIDQAEDQMAVAVCMNV